MPSYISFAWRRINKHGANRATANIAQHIRYIEWNSIDFARCAGQKLKAPVCQNHLGIVEIDKFFVPIFCEMAGKSTSDEANRNGCDAEDDESNAITMLDVLKEENDLEEDANAVLGGSDPQNCTYPQVCAPTPGIWSLPNVKGFFFNFLL